MVGGLLAALAGGGCATSRGAGTPERVSNDMRGSIRLAANEARPAVAGPVHLLHVDYSDDANLELFVVESRDGQPDCTGPVHSWMRLHAHRPNVIDADVPAGQVICVESSWLKSKREVAVSWHATKTVEGPRTLAAAFGLVSNQ
jgi:hypothetical protein